MSMSLEISKSDDFFIQLNSVFNITETKLSSLCLRTKDIQKCH